MKFYTHDGAWLLSYGEANPEDIPASDSGVFVEIGDVPGMTTYKSFPWRYNVAAQAWRLEFPDARQLKSQEIDAACQNQILSGFTSPALGSEHLYPTKMTDQQNLAASILDSLLPDLPDDWTTPFWCADGNDVWDFRPHTASQIQQAGRDVKNGVTTAQAKNAQLQSQIAATTTIEQLDAIVW
ncbi:hypothetical protein AGMMS50256_04730 [Betaproteobacteria bacterium]|nr:hypothetical protein AGMMS50256_04730 [Betaproteobacteria bacterium]